MSNSVKVYMVAGDNGSGNSGNMVFGLYPSLKLANERLASLEENEDGCEYMYIQSVTVGPNGADCQVSVCG